MHRWRTTILQRVTATSQIGEQATASEFLALSAAPGAAAKAEGNATPVAPRRWHETRVWRWLRDMSLPALALCAVPLLLIAWGGGAERAAPRFDLLTTAARQEYLANRAVAFAKDPAITPQQAAVALHRVLPIERRARIPELVREERQHAGAYLAPPDSALFPTVPRRGTEPEVRALLRAATGPLSSAERTWLASLAALPIWTDVDLVAKAGRVDLHRRSPADREAAAFTGNERPHFERMVVRRLAHAGVARAAWHLSQGNRSAADSALRSLVSFASTLLEERLHYTDVTSLRAVAHTGREALAELRGGPGAVAISPKAGWVPASIYISAADHEAGNESPLRHHADYVAMLQNPEIPRAVRMQHVDVEPFVECGSVRSVLLGPSSGGRAASADALRHLARSDDEWRALLAERDAMLRGSGVGPATFRNPFKYFGVSIARLATILTGNSRIEGCTVVALLDPPV